VTVLPAQIHALTGRPTALVFQAVYPMITALFPVAVFYLASRILSVRWAFAAAAFIPTQAVFEQQLPGIARQEIALAIFTALVAAILEHKLPRRVQVPLIVMFTLALALSHYTTTYVTISLIGFTLLLQWGVSWFRSVPRTSVPFAVAFVTAAVGALVWYGPVTHSASNVSQFVQTAEAQGFNLLPNQHQGGNIISNYIEGNTSSPLQAGQYASQVRAQYASSKPFVHPLPNADQRQYAVRNASVPTPPVRAGPVYRGLGVAEIIAQQLIYLLAAVGALMLVLRRRVPVIGRQVGLLTLATLVFLVGIRLSGTLATFYNAERAFLQAMVILNVAVFWCLESLPDRAVLRTRRRWELAGVSALAAGMLTLSFIGGSGLDGAVLGGGTATNLANSGNDYEQFYVTPPELSAASWLGGQVRPGQLVYADRYGQLPLIAMTGISNGLLLDVTPGAIDQHAWVYASTTNVVQGRARADFGDHSVIYAWPSHFLNANYSRVFTDGTSEVYHR
jgi:uncharacterized membrane protein